MANAKGSKDDDQDWDAETSEEAGTESSSSSDNEEDEDWNELPQSPSKVPKRGRVSARGGKGKQPAGRGRGGGRVSQASSGTSKGTPARPFSCPTCEEQFDQLSELEAHLREKLLKLRERQRELMKETEELQKQLEELGESEDSELTEKRDTAKKQEEELKVEIGRVEKELRERQIAALMNVSDDDMKEKLLKAMTIPAEDVVPTETIIGHGAFSDVSVGLWRRIPVAVKSFKDDVVPKGRNAMQDAFLDWGGARHPNMAAIYGFLSSETTSPKFIMEILEGSLQEVMGSIRQSGASLAFREQVELASGVVSGIHYLHSRSKNMIIHGNLWPANILITPFWNPKITDIGLAKYVKPSPKSMPYRAPELRGDKPDEPTKASDRFSTGAILYEVFSGFSPPEDVATFQYDAVIHDGVRSMCVRLLKKKSTDRGTTADALATVKPLRQSEAYKECPPPRRVTGRVRRDNEEFFASI